MAAWARTESAGKMTQRPGSRTKPSGVRRAQSPSSATSTSAEPWSTRVVGRTITGQPSSSESSKASPIIS